MSQTRCRAHRWMINGALLSAAAALGYAWWKRTQRPVAWPVEVPIDRARLLLDRVAPLLRLPESSDQAPQVLSDGSGLRCPATGRVYPYRNGVLDLLPGEQSKTFAQRALDTPFTAWAYDRF